MKFSKAYIILNIGIIVVGIFFPFIPRLTLFEVWEMLIPMGIYLTVFPLILLIALLLRKTELRNRCFHFLIPVSIFIVVQFASVKIVDVYLKYKSNNLISEIENYKQLNKEYPKKLNQITDYNIINYVLRQDNEFELEYGRGFLVREVYNSEEKSWKSIGWNNE